MPVISTTIAIILDPEGSIVALIIWLIMLFALEKSNCHRIRRAVEVARSPLQVY